MLTKKEKWLAVFTVLPLFFTWLIALSFYSKNNNIRKISLRSAFVSYAFLLALLILWLLTKLPFIGLYVQYSAPVLGGIFSLSYIFICIYFMYGLLRDKEINLYFIDKKINSIFQ